MNSTTRELLEQHFDTAFAAPDGINKLRELILALAMQGKLVPQDPNDPPASQLLKEIEAEKSRLWRDGKIKAPKPLPEIKPAEMPYALPQGWEWVRLSRLGYFLGGKTPSTNDESLWGGAIPWVSPKDMKVSKIRSAEDTVSELGLHSGLSLIPRNSILMVVRSGILRRAFPVAINEIECTINQDLKALVPFHPEQAGFLLMMFRGLESYILSRFTKKGVTVESVVFDAFSDAAFPLPPLDEQRRIVAKIDQLMARCDQLERLRAEREQKRRGVHTAALRQLLDAQAVDSIADAWQFISRHFGDLYAVKENVAELRKAILQLAVMGKLVPQNPNDPHASLLLKEIEAEKSRLWRDGKIKAPKPLLEIKPAEMPYALPQGWEWVRLGDIGYTNIGLTYTPSDVADTGIPVLRSNNIQNGKLDLSDLKRVEVKVKESVLVQEGDLLICARNGSKALVGKTALITNLTEPMAFGAFMAIFRSHFNQYLLSFINSPLFRKMIDEVNTMTINQITQDNLRSTLCPLPPLPEQYRIVAKIDQLMALCDTLEQQIDAATSKQTELLDAVMA